VEAERDVKERGKEEEKRRKRGKWRDYIGPLVPTVNRNPWLVVE